MINDMMYDAQCLLQSGDKTLAGTEGGWTDCIQRKSHELIFMKIWKHPALLSSSLVTAARLSF